MNRIHNLGVVMGKITSIGVIGGGQMGEALIRGILKSGLTLSEIITVAEPFAERREYLESVYRIKTTDQEDELAKNSRVVILAVKPQIVNTVLARYRKLLSRDHPTPVAAGCRRESSLPMMVSAPTSIT
ncbi:MAG: hypothetical protein DSY80_02670, partial [Desulfocapsa sp.]